MWQQQKHVHTWAEAQRHEVIITLHADPTAPHTYILNPSSQAGVSSHAPLVWHSEETPRDSTGCALRAARISRGAVPKQCSIPHQHMGCDQTCIWNSTNLTGRQLELGAQSSFASSHDGEQSQGTREQQSTDSGGRNAQRTYMAQAPHQPTTPTRQHLSNTPTGGSAHSQQAPSQHSGLRSSFIATAADRHLSRRERVQVRQDIPQG